GALMRAKAEGDVPVTAIFSIYSQQPDSVFTVEGSGIDSIADLAGRTVATATFSSSNAIWPVLLELNGWEKEDVEILSVDPGALAPMLATGRVDATISWRTVSPIFVGALAEVGKELHMLPWSEFGLDGYGLSVMASDTMIEERPEVLRAFVGAYVEAIAASNADPAAAAGSLAEIETETDADLATSTYIASLPLVDNAISQADGFGAFTHDRLATTWRWVAQSQGYDIDLLDPMDVVDTSFLE
ncbi:MAG: ABC transporter substrate-binding protein, partial [Kiloniellales bacterium]|nr:ABC transporter substrate-binding protein [Kiloniellales bacterium]